MEKRLNLADLRVTDDLNNKQPNDAKIDLTITESLPFMTFTDEFWKLNEELEEDMTNIRPAMKAYAKDKNGKDVEIMHLCTVTDTQCPPTSLFYVDNGFGRIISLTVVHDICKDCFKDQTLVYNSSMWATGFEDRKDYKNRFSFSPNNYCYDLPKPSNDLGDTVKVKSVDIGSIEGFDKSIKRYYDNKLIQDKNIINFIEIDTDSVGWDATTMDLFTLVQIKNGYYRLKHVGPQDVKKIYVPVF